jgi:deoxycytidylate deaminase
MAETATPIRPSFEMPEPKEEVATFKSRYTDEMVIGLVGPVGSGVSKTAELLRQLLERTYGYKVSYMKVSDLIAESAELVGEIFTPEASGHERIAKLQRIGSKLREKLSESFLAEKCVERIALERHDKGGYANVGGNLVPVPRRHVYILDSLKNPAEVQLLRDVYGETFWLFGVFAPQGVRERRLKAIGVDPDQLQRLLSTDEEEGVGHGQKVRDTIEQGDFFIRNDAQNDVELRRSLERYLSIIFNLAIRTPTQDEAAMYAAASAAAASACMSRQVGAALFSPAGEMIGKGSNDVPKFGGGLYAHGDGDEDHRCYAWGGKLCHNDDRKDRLYQEIFKALTGEKILISEANLTDVIAALKRTDIKNLIEYSRANHAEMEAILSVARGHKAGIVGSTMYCTTYPCHSCARLIVGSGVSKVVYIEPYPKSLANVLHSDAISDDKAKVDTHVLFLQYEGVAPKNFVRLFKIREKRKENGKLVVRDALSMEPVCRTPLDGFCAREQIVLKRVGQIEAKSKTLSAAAGGKSK